MRATSMADALSPDGETRLKVAWDRLRSIANESATALYRTGFSPHVRDLIDVGFAVCDRTGRLIAASDIGSPGHMNPLSTVCEGVLSVYEPAQIMPGDVFVLNDPWITSGHLLDMAVVTPVHRGESLVGFVCCIYHATDVGGLGFTSNGTAVYEEGLFLPPTRLVRGGVLNTDVYRLILANVRYKEFFAGDLESAMTSNQVGLVGIQRLLEQLELPDLDWIADEIVQRSERAMRAAIGELRNGTYHACLQLDPLTDGGESLSISVAVTVADGTLLIDFSEGTSDQVRQGLNSTLVYSTGYARYAARLAVTDELPNNAGVLAPIEVRAREGSLVACKHPAPTAMRHAVGQNLPSLVLLALAQAGAPYSMADSSGPSVGIHFQPDDGAGHSGRLSTSGGTGARRDCDGLVATHFPARVVRQPVEVAEQDGYVRFLRRQRRWSSGGSGRYRGGDGMVAEVEFLRSGGMLDVTMERTLSPPAGLFGGGAGQPARATLNDRPLPTRSFLRYEVGDRLLVQSAGGGGWGEPQRPT